jgi:hypothetical protein
MNALIQKAIQAIKDSKTEYAIGLLEGALEMTGFAGTPVQGTVIQSVPVHNPVMPPTDGNDEGSMMDAQARASLAEIKRLSELGQ